MEKQSQPNSGLFLQPLQMLIPVLAIWGTRHKGQLAIPQTCLGLSRLSASVCMLFFMPILSFQIHCKAFQFLPGQKMQ